MTHRDHRFTQKSPLWTYRRIVPVAVLILMTGLMSVNTAAAAVPAVVPPAGSFVKLAPATVFSGSIATHATQRITVTGVPAGSAAWLSVSVTAPTAAGHLTAYTAAAALPATPTLSFAATQTASNAAVVTTSAANQVDLHSDSAAAISVRVDVLGYYAAGTPTGVGMYGSVTPKQIATSVAIAAGGSTTLTATGSGGIPASASVVLTDLTVTAAGAAGTLIAYPTGSTRPTSQSLAFSAGRPQAGLNAVRVGSSGQFTVVNTSTSSVSVTANVLGYYLTGNPTVAGAFQKVAPATLTTGTVAANAAIAVRVGGVATVPSSGVAAVALQVSASTSTATGYLTGYAAGTARPSVPMVPFSAGRTTASLIVVPVNATGDVSIGNNSSGTVSVRVDVVGYYPAISKLTWATPQRVDTDPRADSQGVSCPTTTFCMAVDGDGNTMRFNGTSWTRTLNVDVVGFNAISCTASTFCIAVDGFGRVLRWNGTTWTAPVAPRAGFQALQISCLSPTFCVASSSDASTSWNGTSWSVPATISAPPLFGFDSLSCASTTLCFGAGLESGEIYRFNGSSWSAQTLDSAGGLPSVSCPTTTFCVALDYNKKVFKFNGTSWSATGSAPFADLSLNEQISCRSATFCGAVDGNNHAATFNGTGWGAQVTIDTPNGQAGSPQSYISCASATFCMSTRGTDVVKFNGSSWGSAVVFDPDSAVATSRVSCASSTLCIAMDRGGSTLTFNGTSWGGKHLLDHSQSQAVDVSCPTTTFCMAVLSDGGWATFNGTSWSATHTTSTAGSIFEGVSCVSATFCVAVGEVDNDGGGFPNIGRTFVYRGTSWAVSANGLATTGFVDVSCVSTTFCLAVGRDNFDTGAGTSSVFNGTSWSAVIQAGDSTSGNPRSVSCQSTTSCRAVAFNGRSLTYNGSSWSATAVVPGSTDLVAVSCTASASCLALDSSGKVIQYSGTGWLAPVTVDTVGGPTDISCPSASFCAAVDNHGNAVVARP